jgi:hypothetical protein
MTGIVVDNFADGGGASAGADFCEWDEMFFPEGPRLVDCNGRSHLCAMRKPCESCGRPIKVTGKPVHQSRYYDVMRWRMPA